MALVRCTECGNSISQLATRCPRCGVEFDPMSDAEYARLQAGRRAVQRKDRVFTLKLVAVVVGLLGVAVLLGKSSDERRAEEEREFRNHVNTLDEQQRQRESDQFWRGVGMEKRRGGKS